MSVSMPKSWRIDTFMSGSPGCASAARVIVPPWPRNAEVRFGRACRRIPARNLAETPPVEKSFVRSAIPNRFQIVVGLDDVAQPILAGAVAAIGVRMVALHQGLESRLDVGRSGVRFKPEHAERLALRVADRAALRRRALETRPPRPAGPDLAKYAERIHGAVLAIEARCGPGLAAVDPHFPGRPMPRNRILLISDDRIVAHPGEEIVRGVVLAHMVEAEPPIFAFTQPPLRSAMRRGRPATRPITGRRFHTRATIFVGLDADAIEQGRVEFHDRTLCGLGWPRRKLDNSLRADPGKPGPAH